MFENIIGQKAALQLIKDITADNLAPSLLFSGPVFSGKLTTALELARSVCCLETGSWQCKCSSCLKHRELTAQDVLIIGAGDYTAEITAASQTLLEAKTLAARYLFLRAIRKLTLHFDARLWDAAETDFLKAAPMIAEIENLLAELSAKMPETAEAEKLKKTVTALVSIASKLQEECMYGTLPVNQVRKAASWIRLMPSGKKKILIIENADKMQEGARNAFLKILEEPPSYAFFILTTARRGIIMPTILSRVRTYAFAERKKKEQEEVIERVFRKKAHEYKPYGRNSLLSSFFYRFLPVDFDTIKYAAALFYEMVFDMLRFEKRALPETLSDAVSRAVRGFKQEPGSVGAGEGLSEIVTMLNKCKPYTVYTLFLHFLLSFLGTGLRCGCTQKEIESYFTITEAVRNAESSIGIFNISPQAALENLAESIKEALL